MILSDDGAKAAQEVAKATGKALDVASGAGTVLVNGTVGRIAVATLSLIGVTGFRNSAELCQDADQDGSHPGRDRQGPAKRDPTRPAFYLQILLYAAGSHITRCCHTTKAVLQGDP